LQASGRQEASASERRAAAGPGAFPQKAVARISAPLVPCSRVQSPNRSDGRLGRRVGAIAWKRSPIPLATTCPIVHACAHRRSMPRLLVTGPATGRRDCMRRQGVASRPRSMPCLRGIGHVAAVLLRGGDEDVARARLRPAKRAASRTIVPGAGTRCLAGRACGEWEEHGDSPAETYFHFRKGITSVPCWLCLDGAVSEPGFVVAYAGPSASKRQRRCAWPRSASRCR